MTDTPTKSPMDRIDADFMLRLAEKDVHPIEIAKITDCRDLANELYEALKKAIKLLEPFDDDGLSLGLGENALTDMRAALLKAEGRP